MAHRSAFALALLVAACGSNQMIRATGEFSTVAVSSTKQLSATSTVVADVCRARVEIAFMRSAKGNVGRFHDTYERPLPSVKPGDPPTSWWWICAQAQLADEGFEHGLASIAAYAGALAAIASGTGITNATELEGLATTEAADAAALSSRAGKLKTAIEGVAQPVGELASLVLTYWRSDKIHTLVGRTDEPLHDLVCHLSMFLDAVRRDQLWQARKELALLVRELQALDQPALAYTASVLEVEMTRRLDRIETRLNAMTDLLADLARAHTQLRIGWDDDEPSAIDTLKTLATISKNIYSTVQLIQNPSIGGS